MKIMALVTASVGALFMGCEGDSLEVRTYTLERLEAEAAFGLVDPYVYRDREGKPGTMSISEGLITVRELPENLDRIAEVLEEFDRARAPVRLRFQLIQANGFDDQDESIQAVETELRKLLRYDGYRLVGEAVLQLREGGGGRQVLQGTLEGESPGGSRFNLQASVGMVSTGDRGSTVEIWVELEHFNNSILATDVNAADGQSLVLGTTSSLSGGGALILVVTPTLEGAQGARDLLN